LLDPGIKERIVQAKGLSQPQEFHFFSLGPATSKLDSEIPYEPSGVPFFVSYPMYLLTFEFQSVFPVKYKYS